MDTIKGLFKSSSRKSLFILLISILLICTVLVGVAASQSNGSEKTKIVRQVAEKWIQVGSEQYKRGFYKQSEQSFLRAQDYVDYLTEAERAKLSGLLEKAHLSVLERSRILGHIQTADALINRGELAKAKAHLEKVKGSEYLTAEERQMIGEGLSNLREQLNEPKREMAELYNRSVEYYEAGELEKAREGFIKLSKSDLLVAPAGYTTEDYLVKIDSVLAERASEPFTIKVKPGLKKPSAVEYKPVVLEKKAEAEISVRREVVVSESAEAVKADGSYIEVVNRRRNILQSHTRAVVNDAVAKAEGCLSEGEFDKAKEAVETAERVVNKNQLHLGDDFFGRYSSELKQLSEKISAAEEESNRQLQEQKRIEAIEAQREYRDEMEKDRKKRISELMENSLAYQKQQRYEEALGQLESLLAIDPLHNNALISKQTLDDTIHFRKQLELQKELDKERASALLDADESMIPWASEVTYPKNWREIAAKRKPEEAIGQDPADVAVYEQLDEIVDLSELSPAMSLSEALEILKNSVKPSLRMVVLWRDLYDNADIDQTTAINMDPISAVPLGTGLNLLLKSVSGGFADLGYVVEGGVVTIATVESLPSELETLVYDVTDLLGQPADFFAESGGDISGSTGGETAGGEGFEQEDERDRDELAALAALRADNLRLLIQETVEPDSWYETGGEGSITIYENKKLIVRQTREVHKQIEKLFKEMRKSFGQQVAIEARFLLVGENFLEDIGLNINMYDTDFYGTTVIDQEFQEGSNGWIPNPGYDPEEDPGASNSPWLTDGPVEWDEGNSIPLNPLYQIINIPIAGTGTVQTFTRPDEFNLFQRSQDYTLPTDTGVTGSLTRILSQEAGDFSSIFPAFNLGIGGVILDTLQVDLLLRATQAHRDSTSLTAPKLTVLSGESASLRVQRTLRYPTDWEIDIQELGELAGTFSWQLEYEEAAIITGTVLNITPTIMHDRKNVLLNIVAELRDFLGFNVFPFDLPILIPGLSDTTIDIREPETEISRVETRVSVPDKGTLVLGGQKVTVEAERESGVPILSKIPFIGRAFSNRSKVKDQKILLILVQPTIILQEETEAEAIAAMR